MLLSIVVSAYNVAAYVAECLTSLHTADERCEMIVVDDGSTDGTREILIGLAENWPSMTVITQTNGGVSAARNTGLDHATGDYVWFVDADDRATTDAIPGLLDALTVSGPIDVLHGSYRSLYTDGTIVDARTATDTIWQGDQVGFLERFLAGSRAWAVWANVYRTGMLRQHGIRFDTTLTSGEDCRFFFDAARLCSRFATTPLKLVEYRRGRPGSITTAVDERRALDQWKTFVTVYSWLAAQPDPVSIKVSQMLADRAANVLRDAGRIADRAERDAVYQVALPDLYVTDAASSLRARVARLAWRILGLRLGNRILLMPTSAASQLRNKSSTFSISLVLSCRRLLRGGQGV